MTALLLFIFPFYLLANTATAKKLPFASKTKHLTGKSTVAANFGWLYLSPCLPQTIQFTDSSSTTSVSIVSWSWDFGDGSTSTDQEPLHDYYANGTYTVTLTVTDDLGFSNTQIKSVTVTTNTPVVSLGNDTTVCDGIVVTLDAGPQPGCSYYWSTGETTRQIQVTTTGDYWVQVFNSTCSASSMVRVTVNPKLAVLFDFVKAATCVPVTVQFTDNSVACSSTIVSWNWDFGDGNVSTQQHPSHDYFLPGDYSVHLTVMDNNGVKDSTILTVPITLNALNVQLGNDTSICGSDSITFNPGITGDSYLWSNGDTTSTITTRKAGLYWVQVTHGICTGSDSILLSTTAPMKAYMGVDIPSQCLPVTAHFTDGSVLLCGSLPISSWKWLFGDGDSSILQNPDHVYTKKGVVTVRLVIGNSLGITDTVTRQIEIKTTMPVFNLGADTTICAGSSIQLDAGNAGATYNWQPASLINNTQVQNPVVFPAKTTLFSVDISQCGETIRDSIMIYIDSMVRPAVNQTGNVLNASFANAYQWYKGDQIIETAVNKNFQPQQPGYYQVEAINSRGCRNKSVPFFFLPQNSHNLGKAKVKLRLGPNPAHGTVTVWISNKTELSTKMLIYDVHGKTVYSGVLNGNINTFDVSRLKGSYFVRFCCGNDDLILPLVIF